MSRPDRKVTPTRLIKLVTSCFIYMSSQDNVYVKSNMRASYGCLVVDAARHAGLDADMILPGEWLPFPSIGDCSPEEGPGYVLRAPDRSIVGWITFDLDEIEVVLDLAGVRAWP